MLRVVIPHSERLSAPRKSVRQDVRVDSFQQLMGRAVHYRRETSALCANHGRNFMLMAQTRFIHRGSHRPYLVDKIEPPIQSFGPTRTLVVEVWRNWAVRCAFRPLFRRVRSGC